MMRSTRTTPEDRLDLRNELLRLDFDPRTSDTMYNYIHVRRPDTGLWERVHNFGVDVRAPRSGSGEIINLIGMNLQIKPEPNALRVTYPEPLIQYRQFDDKIGSPELVDRYPDQTVKEMNGLVHADAAMEFRYEIDPRRPAFTIHGKVLKGTIPHITYIISALWTNNHALPTHQVVEGFPEFDFRDSHWPLWREVQIENVAYVIFYRQDGNGVPFALMPMKPKKATVCNFYDNWKCLVDFRRSCLNQQYIPEQPAVTGSNDAGYMIAPDERGDLDGVRVVFFPELGWLQGGLGQTLRERIIERIRTEYFETPASWNRVGNYLPPSLCLTLQPTY